MDLIICLVSSAVGVFLFSLLGYSLYADADTKSGRACGIVVIVCAFLLAIMAGVVIQIMLSAIK